MGNMGRVVAIIAVILTAWFFWPKPTRPLGQLVLIDLRLDAGREAGKPLVIVLDPPVRLSGELLREAEPIGPCSGKACGAVDPRSRAIMMGKVCKGEPDCKPFVVPETPDLYVIARVFPVDDAQTLKREIEARFLGRTMPTTAGETVMIRRVFTAEVPRD